ncbi:hypothetical protein B0T13DRAFT_397222, partial [Neurospora crassa]
YNFHISLSQMANGNIQLNSNINTIINHIAKYISKTKKRTKFYNEIAIDIIPQITARNLIK